MKLLLRAFKLMCIRRWADLLATKFPLVVPPWHRPKRLGFIVGCGRSGTSILGQLLGLHPDIHYIHEPWHFWAVVDPRTDVNDLFHTRSEGRYFLDAAHCSSTQRARFNRIVNSVSFFHSNEILVEKTPHNVARIGFLEELISDAFYIHIIRNGMDVTRSIAGIATSNWYKIAGKPNYNQWWGNDDCRWRALAKEAKERGYFPDEVSLLQTNLQKGAYEWVVSLGEADRWRAALGSRMFQLTYDELTSDVDASLSRICDFLGARCPDEWLQEVSSRVQETRTHSREPLSLPTRICDQFNRYQRHYGFGGMAIPCPKV